MRINAARRRPDQPAGEQSAEAILEARGVASGYSEVMVIEDVNLTVRRGEVVAILGSNGAGKSTTLLTLAGELPPGAGSIRWCGAPSPGQLWKLARGGLGFVPEGRSVFPELSAIDNLKLARGDVDMALNLFPELRPCLNRPAGLLSGGEQQMLSIGRALTRRPKALLVDEVSLGLAPLVVRRLLEALRGAAEEGVGVVMVEQHPKLALAYADRVYVMRRGRVTYQGTAQQAANDATEIEAAYLT
jgi:branched-chain amino acid transport system ATP-binding protein